MTTTNGHPSRLALARGPALITLVVIVARLSLELMHAPKWLASPDPGGPGAFIGIAWLPFIFGPWFALQIGRAIPTTGARVKRLASTLAVYGWLARIPNVIVTFIAMAAGWNTHYTKFAKEGDPDPTLKIKILDTLAFQLGVWVIYTVITGLIAGLIALAIARPKAAVPVTP
jgi:hypothetical protein